MTKQVWAGTTPIGGGAPVAVQSMCNTDTRDVEKTVAQIHRLEQAGCELIRVAVFDMQAAEAIRQIRDRIHIPLVADVHFDYRLAMKAVENGVDKLRINPGNIGSKERVRMVADCCKAHHVPIRIGVNGGSLEKNLLSLYATDPAAAMLKSALGHVKILEDCNFSDIVLSLKCTTVAATVAAYRLAHERTSYPLHVGITETGPVETGIIKSAAGIGSLLMDGIGDTIRVSLTCDPVREVETGLAILRAVGVRKDDVEIVSCPTCGRTRCNVEEAVAYVDAHVKHRAGYLKIAVMGCAVNGPGEARAADLGVAFGDGKGVLFQKGEITESGSYETMLKRVVEVANGMLDA
jgi:(E)-4-hydroxy-3-methylbut-2-enyl-diphosphate synthase